MRLPHYYLLTIAFMAIACTSLSQIEIQVIDSIETMGYGSARLGTESKLKLDAYSLTMNQNGEVYVVGSVMDEGKTFYTPVDGVLKAYHKSLPEKERITRLLFDEKDRLAAIGLRASFTPSGDNWLSIVEDGDHSPLDHLFMHNTLYTVSLGRIMTIRKFKWQHLEGSESRAKSFGNIDYVAMENGEIYAMEEYDNELFHFADKKWTSIGQGPVEQPVKLMLRADGVLMISGHDKDYNLHVFEYIQGSWKEMPSPVKDNMLMRVCMTNDGMLFCISLNAKKNYDIHYWKDGTYTFVGEVDGKSEYYNHRFSSSGKIAYVLGNKLYIGSFRIAK